MAATEDVLVGAALKVWKSNVERGGKFFNSLADEQLQIEVAPGKNRLLYLWGHLIAVNDAMLPLMGFGPRLHPELDEAFLSNADRIVPHALSAAQLTAQWNEVHQRLQAEFEKLSASDWLRKHAAVSVEDFGKEPGRNCFAILLSRTNHLAYHLGQAILAPK